MELIAKCPLCRLVNKFTKLNNITNIDICSICLDELGYNICHCNGCKQIFHIKCIKHIEIVLQIQNNNIEEVSICKYYCNKIITCAFDFVSVFISIVIIYVFVLIIIIFLGGVKI